MECPKILGKTLDVPEEEFELQVPAFFEFENSKISTDFDVKMVNAVKKGFTDISEIRYVDPFVKDRFLGRESEFVNCQSSYCPLPVNQGPIIPGIDNDRGDKFGDKLLQKISWRHSDEQSCGLWTPNEKDVGDDKDVFGKFTVEPYPDGSKTVGPHSNMSGMSVVYTCTKMRCELKCPCKLCLCKREDCRRKCLDFPCKKCAMQCKIHRIELNRNFDFDRHAFTVKTDCKGRDKFVVKHAGMPLDCEECSNDLLDHRTFHRVIHPRCKLCLQIKVLAGIGKVRTFADFKRASNENKKMSDLTCSTCSKTFYDKHNRQRHESLVHSLDGKYGCDQCERKFANPSDLEYHFEAKHRINPEPKLDCGECGKTYKNGKTLRLHMMYMHSEVKKHECDKCDTKFTRKDSLRRHQREHHSKLSVNWNMIQLREDALFKCDKCEKAFKRKNALSIHEKLNHAEQGTSNERNHEFLAGGEADWAKLGFVSNVVAQRSGND